MSDTSKSFSQSRKGEAQTVTPQARSILTGWYDTTERKVVSVETTKEGTYDTKEMGPVDILDFNGIDWLIESDQGTVPVGQRVLKENKGNFTLRVNNGSQTPSERETIPKGIKNNGLFPRDYLLAFRDGFRISEAYLIDMPKLLGLVDIGAIPERFYDNDDGSSLNIYPLDKMKNCGCIKQEWSE